MKPTEEELREMLRRALPPAQQGGDIDLWPRLLRRMDEKSVRMSWLDRALLLAVSLGLIAFPAIIPQLFYQL